MVRRDGMAVVESRGVDLALTVGIEKNQVGIKPFPDRTLTRLEASEFRRLLAHPADDAGDSDAAALSLRPDDRQAEFERSNATPGLAKAAGAALFHIRRTRRVIGSDQVDVAGHQGS